MLGTLKVRPALISVPIGIALVLFGLFEGLVTRTILNTATNPQIIVTVLIAFGALTEGIAHLSGLLHFQRSGIPKEGTNWAQYVNIGEGHLSAGLALGLGLILHLILGFTGVVNL